MEKLPLELQLRIFGLFTHQKLLKAGSICKKWHQLACSLTSEEKISIDGRKQAPEKIINFLRNNFAVREIELAFVKDWDFVNYLPVCKNLRTIAFKFCTIDGRNIQKLIELWPEIETLSVQFVQLDFRFIRNLILWKHLKNISLILSRDCSRHVKEGRPINLLGEIYLYMKKHCPQIQHIEFIGFDNSTQDHIRSYKSWSNRNEKEILEFGMTIEARQKENESLRNAIRDLRFKLETLESQPPF